MQKVYVSFTYHDDSGVGTNTTNSGTAGHASSDAGHSLADTITFVINELTQKSLVATDRLVMRHFVAGDDR